MKRTVMLIACVSLLLALAGCYENKAPLVTIGDTGFGKPRPDVSNIPPGPEHDVCRAELSNALSRVQSAEKKLDDCRRDRDDDKGKWKAEKAKLEADRDYWKRMAGH